MQFLRTALLTLPLWLPGLAMAQQGDNASEALSVELNAADPVEAGCRLTFVLRNELQAEIEQLTVETVLFSEDGQVILLTLFDFGALPVGRPRVRQFEVPQVPCDGLGMVLVNGADTCRGAGLDPRVCEGVLAVSSRTDIAMEG